MRILLALRAFFAVLFNKERAVAFEKLLLPGSSPSEPNRIPTETKQTAETDSSPAAAKKPAASSGKAPRSEALTLLSTLQREARLIDLIQESLDSYSDAQIGAAARDVLRDSKKCLQRAFGIKPLLDQSEGDSVSIPESPSPIRWRLLGSPKSSGRVVHPGWTATHCELPTWSGNPEDQWVLSAAEVET
ncbi:DUF2760 domain-containing protein [Pirellulaceae bacterium SH501]